MTVKELSLIPEFTVLTMPSAEREIKGGYAGDLLSWVMGRGEADEAWITIMSNANTIAVASLIDFSCIILAEGVTLDKELLDLAASKEINVLTTHLPAYECAVLLSSLGV